MVITMSFIVDFHSAGEDGLLTTSFEDFVGSSVFGFGYGTSVVLDDLEGHTCSAVVRSIRGDLIDVRINWTTWQDANVLSMEEFSIEGVVHSAADMSWRDEPADITTGVSAEYDQLVSR